MSIISQKSFSGGELAPDCYARTDTNKFSTGLRTCRNLFVMRQGGTANRAGTEFVGEVKDSSKQITFIPFVFNDSQTYVLEFGDQYMRVHQDGVQLTLTGQNITGITNANPCVVTYAGADTYANGDEIYISGIVGAIGTYLNGRNFKVVGLNAGANTFELDYLDGTNVNSTSFGAYTSGGTVEEVYEIATPYVEADLSNLQFVQSADVITIVHPTYAPRELARSGHTSWTLSTITFAPTIAAPVGLANTGAAGSTTSWVVTAVDPETGEESLASTATSTSAIPTAGAPVTVSWTAHATAVKFYVYKAINAIYGFIGTAGPNQFTDTGITPDTTDTPPEARNPFGSSSNYPSTVTYFQQRQLYASTTNDPETVWGSRNGLFENFTTSNPIQDDDAVTFTLAGRQVNEVRHLIDIGQLIALTSSGEMAIQGDSSGILTPTAVNPKQYTYFGSSKLPPIIVDSNALYVQARGSIIRDLAFNYQTDGYNGNDLTIFSSHLFDGYEIVDWAFQKIPHSIVWAVRSDGVLLGLTYIREHQMWAWHRHDTDGLVENVCCVPEGNEDAVYLCVKRTINGATKRYIERMARRTLSDVDDVIDSKFMDCSLSYDGRNTSATTMTLTGGTAWTFEETLTLTASAAYFAAADVGNEIHLYIEDADGNVTDTVRCVITAYTSTTVVSVNPNKTVPVALRGVATLNWAEAVDSISGLWHLEGEAVSIFADRFVVGSPNNASYTTYTVASGAITLDRPYAVVHVGLPYISDFQTLDIDTMNGETLVDKQKLVTKATLHLSKSRGLWLGGAPPTDDDTDPLEGLVEMKLRNLEGYDEPVDLLTGTADVNFENGWNSNGRMFIRQVDPIPCAILAVAPAGNIPFK
jgi:hypothetical protein